MYYLIIDDAGTKETIKGLSVLYIEVNDEGNVSREVGLGSGNQLVHAYPSTKFRYGDYGIFDLASFETKNLKSDISKDEFEKIWTDCLK